MVLFSVRKFAKNDFNPLALYYYYHAVGYSNFSDQIINGRDEDVTDKIYFYTFKYLFYSSYILEHRTLPPKDFENALKKTLLIPEYIKDIILNKIIPAKIA